MLVGQLGQPANPRVPFVALAPSKGVALIEALGAGVRRVVLLSASAIPAGGSGPGLVHTLVADTVPEWAVLRPSWFMQNLSEDHMHAHTVRERGEIVTATGDGRIPFIDAGDIAAVAAHALTDPTPHDTEHVLTGPDALTYAEIATMISEVSGRPVRHHAVSVDDLRGRLVESGIPDGFAVLLADLDHAIAGGAEDRTTTTVADVTGRAPNSFRRFCAEHARRWHRAG